MHPRLRRGLYLVTRDGTEDGVLLAIVGAALDGGAALVQYRDKSNDRARRRRQAQALVELCTRYAVPLLINDDVELAHEVGADGVHLGAQDASLAAARARLGDAAIIGASCYDDLARARRAADAGADYLAFGSFFPSPTKPAARRADPALLAASATFGRPRVAIGGITADNAAPLVAAGADLVAVISDIFDAAEPRAAAARFRLLFRSGPFER